MAGSSTVCMPCFLCWEHGHFRNECPWMDYTCVLCNKAPMSLFVCKKGDNKGRTFLKCSTQPICDVFIWLDELKKKIADAKKENDVSVVKEGKVKLTMEGRVKMVFEGDIDDVCEIVMKLGLN